MATKYITGVLIDVENQTIRKHTLAHESYKDFYPLLNCDTFDIQRRTFENGADYDIFIDDEGLYKENLIPAIITYSKSTHAIVEVIYGNCFITQTNEEGETISIPEEEIKQLLRTIKIAMLKDKTCKVMRAYV